MYQHGGRVRIIIIIIIHRKKLSSIFLHILKVWINKLKKENPQLFLKLTINIIYVS